MTRKERFEAMVRDRNARVLGAALALTDQRGGWSRVTRDDVARLAGVAAGCVTAAYGSMDALRDEVLRRAIECELLGIVAQGVATMHPLTRDIDPDLKARALATLT